VVNPELKRIVPYLLLISLIGNFIMIQLRKRFIVDYKLPYPSSTVAGIVLNSLHVKGGQQRAIRQARPPRRMLRATSCARSTCGQGGSSSALVEPPGPRRGAQVKTIWYTGVASFCWSCVRWLFTRSDVPGCGGLEMMPTFGYAALRQVRPGRSARRMRRAAWLAWGALTCFARGAQTMNFDWQLNFVGVGARPAACPSCVLGARPAGPAARSAGPGAPRRHDLPAHRGLVDAAGRRAGVRRDVAGDRARGRQLVPGRPEGARL
jgi:hypothetical protein